MNRTVRAVIIAIAVAGIIYGSSTTNAERAKSRVAPARAAATQAGAAAARDLH